MGTASTKSRKSKPQPRKEKATGGVKRDLQAPEPLPEDDISRRTWWVLALLILLIAAALRFYDLALVPLHHDEGVNGNFLVRLVRDGYYHYDPANYHGPTLYYFAALFPWLLRILGGSNAQNMHGLTTVAIRCVPALFGLATIALIFVLRRRLGSIATLSAAFLLAVSPGAVYLSRYFIHETLFTFFTLALVVALLKYFEKAQVIYLTLAAISAALLFATKETAIISVAVLVIAIVMTHAYRWFWAQTTGASKRKKKGDQESLTGFVDRVGGPLWLTLGAGIAIIIFILVNVLFYSSFMTNFPQGVYDSLKTFQFWTKTGKESHVHPFSMYVWWLLEQESPLLLLGSIGAMLTVLYPKKSFALFSALWAFGLTAAYSLIAYKTPWLALNFIVPLALTSGVAIQWLYSELAKWEVTKATRAALVAAVLLIAIGPLPGATRVFTEVM